MTGGESPRCTSHPRRRGSQRSGFTLIEVLVAITILSVIAMGVQRAVVVAVDGTTRADRHLAAEMVARTLLSGPLGTGTSATRPQEGEMNGFVWTLRFEPLDRSFPGSASDGTALQWRPARMLITVRGSASAAADLKVETIRLVRAGSP